MVAGQAVTSRHPGGVRRLAGVDAARGVALLAMMAVHVLPELDPDGTLSTADAIARGRSSAAFAVLAGVALVLAHGGRRQLRGRRWAAASCGLLVRCAMIGVLGLTLAGVGSGLAIILVNYALLFALAAPLLALSARTLALLAGAGVLVVPVGSHLARTGLPPMRGYSPWWGDLAEPARLLTELTLTGYYPVLAWTAYLCAGLAVGRLQLSSPTVARRLVLGGAALAVASAVLSYALVEAAVASGNLPDTAGATLATGTTPTDSWWWLAVDSPHSSTPLDLAHTTGTALALLGAALLLARRLGDWLLPLAWVGSMTLTLYTVHAVALGLRLGPADPEQLYVAHVIAAFVAAAALRSWAPRGPLEQLVSGPSRGAAQAVLRRSGTSTVGTTPDGAAGGPVPATEEETDGR